MLEASHPQGASGTHISPARQPCRHFLNGGHCPFGERCRFLHIKRSVCTFHDFRISHSTSLQEMPPSRPSPTGQYKSSRLGNQEDPASSETRATSLQDPLSTPRHGYDFDLYLSIQLRVLIVAIQCRAKQLGIRLHRFGNCHHSSGVDLIMES